MASSPTVSIGQHSDRGAKEINQDFHGAIVPPEPAASLKGIAVALADGISSSQHGREASETAVKSFLADYYGTSDAWTLKTSASRVIAATNSWLHARSRRGEHPYDLDRGWVCTFAALIVKARTAHLFHVGDSGICRVSGASLERLTEDHRVVVSATQSHLGRALGMARDVEIDHRALPIAPGDVFVLATDGVFDHLSGKRIVRLLGDHAGDLDAAARAIVAEALAAGSHDNLTVQIVRIETLPEGADGEAFDAAPDLPPAPVLEPRAVLDGYRIEREIHASARSHVYLATDLDSGDEVALKVPAVDLRDDPAHLRRFMMEEWVARRIDSPHVVAAPPRRRRRSAIYTVTEYVEGRTLAQWTIDHPAPDLETVRGLIEQIAKGLRAFHRKEMLHRDLRPANVLIDRSGTVKLIDFGAVAIAGVIEAMPETDAGEVLGTAQYTAPEYYLGEAGTTRSDLYSLGVIAYQLLTGRLPYGTRVAAARTRRAQRRLVYASALDDDRAIPAWIDRVLARAVAVDPAKRPEALSEFVHELRHGGGAAGGPRPFVETNPLRFWQGLAVAAGVTSLLQLVAHLAGRW